MKRMHWRMAAALCGLLLLGRGLSAAPLDTRIPADAVVYAGWAGADALATDYAGTNLQRLMADVKLADYVRGNWENWMSMVKARGGDPAEIEAGATIVKMLWRHPGAIYVGPPDLKNMQKPGFKAAFLIDAGADAPALMDWYKTMKAKFPPPPEMKLQVTLDGTVVIVTLGEASPDAFENKLGEERLRLINTPNYAAAVKSMQKNPAITLYVDAAKIVATIQDVSQRLPGLSPADKKKGPEIIQALGLNGLTQIAMTGGFDNKQWSEQAFIGTTGPRVGLLALLDGDPVSDDALAMVPRDVGSMNIGRMDLQKTMALVREVIGKADPAVLAQFQTQLAKIGKQFGLDIDKDVIDAFGDEWISYRGPVTGDGHFPFVVVQKLRNAAGLSKALDVMEKQVNAAAQGKFTIEKLQTASYEVTGVQLPPSMAGVTTTIAWTIRNQVLYVSTLEGMDSAIEQVEKKNESIATNPGYKAVRAALPQVKATSVTFNDPAKLYPELYRGLMMALPFAQLAGFNVPEDLVPTPKQMAAYTPPGGAISWSDADGFHFASRSAYPGAELLGGQ